MACLLFRYRKVLPDGRQEGRYCYKIAFLLCLTGCVAVFFCHPFIIFFRTEATGENNYGCEDQ